jgi:hypothetical protein
MGKDYNQKEKKEAMLYVGGGGGVMIRPFGHLRLVGGDDGVGVELSVYY